MKSNQEVNEFQHKAHLIEKKLEKMRKNLGSPNKPKHITNNNNLNQDHNLSREMNHKLIYNHSRLW